MRPGGYRAAGGQDSGLDISSPYRKPDTPWQRRGFLNGACLHGAGAMTIKSILLAGAIFWRADDHRRPGRVAASGRPTGRSAAPSAENDLIEHPRGPDLWCLGRSSSPASGADR